MLVVFHVVIVIEFIGGLLLLRMINKVEIMIEAIIVGATMARFIKLKVTIDAIMSRAIVI